MQAGPPDTPHKDPVAALRWELDRLRELVLSQPTSTADAIVRRLLPQVRRVEERVEAL